MLQPGHENSGLGLGRSGRTGPGLAGKGADEHASGCAGQLARGVSATREHRGSDHAGDRGGRTRLPSRMSSSARCGSPRASRTWPSAFELAGRGAGLAEGARRAGRCALPRAIRRSASISSPPGLSRTTRQHWRRALDAIHTRRGAGIIRPWAIFFAEKLGEKSGLTRRDYSSGVGWPAGSRRS